MTHTVFGKKKDGQPGRLTVIGAPSDEAEVRESVKGTHPDFVAEQVVEGIVAELPNGKKAKTPAE